MEKLGVEKGVGEEVKMNVSGVPVKIWRLIYRCARQMREYL